MDFQNDEYIVSVVSREKPKKYLQEIEQLRGRKRVWFLFSHICYFYPCKVNEETYLLQHLDKIGKKVLDYKSPGASLYLYDLSINTLLPTDRSTATLQ